MECNVCGLPQSCCRHVQRDIKDTLRLYEPMMCDRCKETSVCTPANDFYLTPFWNSGRDRVCEKCFQELTRKAGYYF